MAKKKTFLHSSPIPFAAIFGGDGIVGPFNLQVIENIILQIARNILSYVGLLAVIMIIIAGIYLIANGGDDGARDKAKKIVLYTVIGLIVILLSSALVNFVIDGIL